MSDPAAADRGSIEPGEAHRQVTDAVLADLAAGTNPAVIVDSPPGAGKSTFVVQAAAELAADGQVPIVAQTNAQADDLVVKLRSRHPDLTVGRLTGSSYDGDVVSGPGLIVSTKLGDMGDARIVIGTSSKWGYVYDQSFRVGIIDEAYQMRSDQLLYVADLFPRALLVGDPGQLDPFTPVDDSRWRGQPDGPVTPAVATVRHNHPQLVPHKLPVSWRLSAKCAPLVAESFYPELPFNAGTGLGDRALTDPGPLPPSDADPLVDQAISTAVEGGWAQIELPERVCPALDEQAIDIVAQTALRLIQRQLAATDSPGDDGAVGADRVAVGVAHRNQRSAVRIRLDELGRQAGLDVSGITVDTANRLQGREFHVVVVLHPLSGRAAASEFHLETGRLCVLLSRHRHACIVVARAGIPEVLDAHPMSRPVWIGAPLPVPDGWEANQVVLEKLDPFTVSADLNRPQRRPLAPVAVPPPSAGVVTPSIVDRDAIETSSDTATGAEVDPMEAELATLLDNDIAELVSAALESGAPHFTAGAEHQGEPLEAAWKRLKVAVLLPDQTGFTADGWDARPVTAWSLESLLAVLDERS